MAVLQKEEYTENDYYNLPEDVRAEIINGRIYYQAAPSRIHQKLLSELHALIHSYIKAKGRKCQVYPAPFAVKLKSDKRNIVEPDISVICDPKKLTDKGCCGAPDWIIEIVSSSSSSHDYIRKLNLYAESGVREYWIVNPMNQTVFVYYLEEAGFQAASYHFSDEVRVNIYEDFQIVFGALDLY